jgi:mRNA interferase RelE/StbE
MIKLDLKPRALKFIKSLPKKHKRQIKNYILRLQENPFPHDAKLLIGYNPYLRADCGEYRIIYKFDTKKELVTVVLIGKRNGDEVYRHFKRMVN